MRRWALTATVLIAATQSVRAEVWMVEASGALGCRDREKLVEHEAAHASRVPDGAPPEGCVALYPGERLLDQPEIGVGANEVVRVQRSDGSIVFVMSSAVAPDPGIGSIEDRAQ